MDIFIESAKPKVICANVALSVRQSRISCFDADGGMNNVVR
jgi:hypothetical protein